MAALFIDEWTGPLRALVVAVLAYAALVALLRGSGKRTLARMNAFDLVVTVALGSTLATTVTSQDVALARGVTALATLIGLQFVIAWLAVRSGTASRIVKSAPRLLLHRGRMLQDALHDERVTPDEVRAAVRSQGIGSLADVEAVVLETDGTFSVVLRVAGSDGTALTGVTPSSAQDRAPETSP